MKKFSEKYIPADLLNKSEYHWDLRLQLRNYLKGRLGLLKFVGKFQDKDLNYFIYLIMESSYIKIPITNIHYQALKALFIYMHHIGSFPYDEELLNADEGRFFDILYKINPLLSIKKFYTKIIYHKNG